MNRRLDALGEGEPMLSTDAAHSMRIETLGAVVSDIVDDMLIATPLEATERFQLRDLRRTCETMLASLKISSDVRVQLQSHGLGSIQQRHYDRHDYMLEKKQALENWARHMERLKAGERAQVVPIGKGRALKPDR